MFLSLALFTSGARAFLTGTTKSILRNILRRLCRTVWIACVLLLTLCVFNYPRIWWQEAINSLALLWGPLLLISIGIEIRGMFRRRVTVYRSISLALQVACCFSVISIVIPYITYSKNNGRDLGYSAPISILLVDDSARGLTTTEGAPLPTSDIVVIVGSMQGHTVHVENDGELPYAVQSASEREPKVEIRSRFPFNDTAKRDVGYKALPAVFGTFAVSEGTFLEIGAFDLKPSLSQEDFVASRLTSRRIATLLRFSTTPRMVLGAFHAPITSQIVDMYPDQVRLKSVLFNQGISGLWRRIKEVFSWGSALNAFVAKNIILERVTEYEYERDGWRGISFVARVPLKNN